MYLMQFWHIMWSERKTEPLRIIRKSYARYKKHGWNGMLQRLEKDYKRISMRAYSAVGKESDYAKWIKQNETDLNTAFLSYKPLVSIIVPTYNTQKRYLEAMLESVLEQTYTCWELCIADDASTLQETKEVLTRYSREYSQIKVLFRETNGHISEASNSALSLASGEYVAFLDHDDTLAPNALYEMVKKLNENRDLKLIYSDEDKIDENDHRFDPHFKSGWNPDMFFSQNYICHFVVLKKEVVDAIGGFRKGYEGSQDYDLLLRAIKHIEECQIDRVEKVLYHWRAIKGSTAYGSGEKSYTHEAGKKALEDYFEANNRDIAVIDGMLPNTYKINYPLPADPPLVSLVIPTRDRYDILHKCIESILEKTVYPNYEILVVDNETTCPRTLDYFEKIKQHKHIRILEYHHPFNYSAMNNFAVRAAKGDVIGLINNDVEIISKGWLSEMVSHAIREEIGAVGAMLYYDNDTIQHAGVVLGIGGVAGHSHKYFKKGSFGYFLRLQIVQNYAAVTGACLIVEKRLFEEVGGLEEEHLKVAFNDVDFCLKLKAKGYRNIWTPYAELYHHESISRGKEDNPEKARRFQQEVLYMQQKWSKILQADPYYNRNLTQAHENFDINMDNP